MCGAGVQGRSRDLNARMQTAGPPGPARRGPQIMTYPARGRLRSRGAAEAETWAASRPLRAGAGRRVETPFGNRIFSVPHCARRPWRTPNGRGSFPLIVGERTPAIPASAGTFPGGPRGTAGSACPLIGMVSGRIGVPIRRKAGKFPLNRLEYQKVRLEMSGETGHLSSKRRARGNRRPHAFQGGPPT